MVRARKAARATCNFSLPNRTFTVLWDCTTQDFHGFTACMPSAFLRKKAGRSSFIHKIPVIFLDARCWGLAQRLMQSLPVLAPQTVCAWLNFARLHRSFEAFFDGFFHVKPSFEAWLCICCLRISAWPVGLPDLGWWISQLGWFVKLSVHGVNDSPWIHLLCVMVKYTCQYQ